MDTVITVFISRGHSIGVPEAISQKLAVMHFHIMLIKFIQSCLGPDTALYMKGQMEPNQFPISLKQEIERELRISAFTTMFSDVICCRCSICGKGFNNYVDERFE